MRYDVKQQITNIDKARWFLSLLTGDTMKNPTEEELKNSMKE